MGRDYTKMKGWQLADELVLVVYKAQRNSPMKIEETLMADISYIEKSDV